MYASLQFELQHQIQEQLRYVEEASVLEEEVKEGSKTLVKLDDRIGEIQKQIDDLLGGDGNALSQAIHSLRVQVDRDKDRIEDAKQADIDDNEELEISLERYNEAANALELLLTEVETSKTQLEECERMLAEAQSEEDEVRSLLEGSGKTNAELNRALGDAIGALEEAKKDVASAQSEVDRTAAKVELIASSIGMTGRLLYHFGQIKI